jgi:hypothetical protein
MQAGELTIVSRTHPVNRSSVGTRIGHWVARVFGCWHLDMSRPFSRHGQAYRVCLNCGAQRQFNLGNWQMKGNLYYERANTNRLYPTNDFAAVKKAA